MIKERKISNYKEFVQVLSSGLNFFQQKSRIEWEHTAIKYVDGLAADELRRLVDLETRRKYGVFFTDSKLAKKVLQKLKPTFNKKSVLYDPACGAGNLIISAYDYMHERGISLTVDEHFLGTDIHEEFIQAAKARFSINQLLHPSHSIKNIDNESSIFRFTQSDGLKQNEYYDKASHIIVNPPFNLISPKESLVWSKGKVSTAALFIDKIIQNINPGTAIFAILPDVLRSGSRYEKWRRMVQEKCITGTTKLLGQFDKYADVDVFAIKLTKRKNGIFLNQKKIRNSKNKKIINDLFDVCVGPVVDNRDDHIGQNRKYIVSKGLKGWTIQSDLTLSRKHKGKCFKSPFVVVKRTSRMGDSQRAVATIINTHNPVYVDNHLIILRPKTGTLKDCKKLVEILKDSRTDEWLNEKIRCRHLTVKIVNKIPIWQ